MESLLSSPSSLEDEILEPSFPLLSPINNATLFHEPDREIGSTGSLETNESNENDNESHDDYSCTSDEFYGRVDHFPFEEEQDEEWYQYLNEYDRAQLQRGTKIQPEDWKDRYISDVGENCELFLDSAKKEAIESCYLEIKHIQNRLKEFLRKRNEDKVSIEEIFELALGEKVFFTLQFLKRWN